MAKVIAYSLFIPLIPFILYWSYGGLNHEVSNPILYLGVAAYLIAAAAGFVVMFPHRHDLP